MFLQHLVCMERPQNRPELAAAWRRRAELLAQYGDPNSARLWRLAADELDAMVASEREVPLTLHEAAKRTGYTVDHLAERIRRGELPNAGRKGAPRLRVCDLPAPKRSAAPRAPSSSPATVDVLELGRRARRG